MLVERTMTAESPDQVREKHLRDMGPELGPVYHALWKEVAWLHAKWNQYRQLYAHSPERVAFLNRVASHFFGVVQDTLYDDILLHLARLTDPPKSGRNLTLQRLPKIAPPALRVDLKKLVQAACDACEPARSSRNKRIAHEDVALALAGTFDPLPSRADIEVALRAVSAVLHRLETHYWQSETAYQHFAPAGGEADSLVHYLLEGVRAEERRMECFLQRKPLQEDLAPEDDVIMKRPGIDRRPAP